ncbi:unnamed protein product [Moneuplotes crassus]|uniref:Uncharacterized protein n=1 Tax=Euplotes crassus TaxID=5936 RepID=A0AAD1U067_EUPCR|nr:unnamed protein product [Moneuplotes crassus]
MNKSTFSQFSNFREKKPNQFARSSPRDSYNLSTKVSLKNSGTNAPDDSESLKTKGSEKFYKNFTLNRGSLSCRPACQRSISTCSKDTEPVKVNLFPEKGVKPKFQVSKSKIKEIVDKILSGESPNFEEGCYEIKKSEKGSRYQNSKIKQWRRFVQDSDIPLNYLFNDSMKQSIGLQKTKIEDDTLNRYDPHGVRMKILPVIFTENKNFSSIKDVKDLIEYEVMETGQLAEEVIFKRKRFSLAPPKRTSPLGNNDRSGSPRKIPRMKQSFRGIKTEKHTQSGLNNIINSFGTMERGNLQADTSDLEFNVDIKDLKQRRYLKFPKENVHVNRYVKLVKTITSKKEELTEEDVIKYSQPIVIKPNLKYITELYTTKEKFKPKEKFTPFHKKLLHISPKHQTSPKTYQPTSQTLPPNPSTQNTHPKKSTLPICSLKSPLLAACKKTS